MNEEIEYAEMLEIPVSTVNVVKKKQTKKRKLFSRHENKLGAYLKESVLQRVNDKVAGYPSGRRTNGRNACVCRKRKWRREITI